MPYEELISSMEEDCNRRYLEAMEQARGKVAEEKRKVEDQAEEIRNRWLSMATRKAFAERHRQLYRAREEAKAELAQTREILFDQTFLAAAQDLTRVRGMVEYHTILRHMIEEALADLGEKEARIHIDPRDMDLCTTLLHELGLTCPIISDLTSDGGIIVSSADERIEVKNTVESRLLEIRDRQRMQIYHQLFGGV